METKEEFRQRMNELMNQADDAIKEASTYLMQKGVVVDLTDWVTIKEYCRRYNIKSTETISNWIRRGIIPADDVMVVEEFNNIRLIRAKPYHVKADTSA